MHTPDDLFYHDHGDGIIHCHEHKPASDIQDHEAHEHPHHNHSHSHTQSKAVINRLSRAIGHLESVKRMVEDERDEKRKSICTSLSFDKMVTDIDEMTLRVSDFAGKCA